MATDEDAVASPPPLQEAAARVGARTITALGSRLELAGVELALARERAIVSLLLAGAALACAMLALAAASFGVIAYFWDTARFTAIVVVTVAYVVAAVALWLRFSALRRTAPSIFASTFEALRRDAARLTGEES